MKKFKFVAIVLLILTLLIIPHSVQASGETYTTFGDSITSGGSASDEAHRYVNIIAGNQDWILNNKAVGGTQLGDMGWQIYPYDAYISSALVGYNDMRHGGSNSALRNDFKGALYALATWCSLTDRKTGKDASITYSGSWTNSGAWQIGKYSTTSGSTATFTAQGTVIYIGSINLLNGYGQFKVETRDISGNGDWINKGTYNCYGMSAPLASTVTFTPMLIRLTGYTSGKTHDVRVTTLNSGIVYFDWVGSNSGTKDFYLGDCLPMNSAGYAYGGTTWGNGSDTAVNEYNADIASVVSALQSDGLNIHLVDASKYYNINTDVWTDNIHPNDSGYAHIAQAFIEVMNNVAPTNPDDDLTGSGIINVYEPEYSYSFSTDIMSFGDISVVTNGNIQMTASIDITNTGTATIIGFALSDIVYPSAGTNWHLSMQVNSIPPAETKTILFTLTGIAPNSPVSINLNELSCKITPY